MLSSFGLDVCGAELGQAHRSWAGWREMPTTSAGVCQLSGRGLSAGGVDGAIPYGRRQIPQGQIPPSGVAPLGMKMQRPARINPVEAQCWMRRLSACNASSNTGRIVLRSRL